MEFRVHKGEFLTTLYWTQSIVERRHTMPILANVLIEAQKGEIRVVATDLEVGVRSGIKGEILTEGEISVNARKLYEIVRESPDEVVQVKGLENDWVEIKSGKSKFKMVGINAKEFPQFPQFAMEKLIPVPIKILREMIEKTIFSVSSDETRHNLNGVFVEEADKGMVRMVATDGHRLALIERSIGSMGLDKGVIIPRKGLAELKKLLEESEEGVVSIGFQDNMGLVTKDNVQLFMRLIDEDFPDYSKVVPKDNPYEMKVAREGFLQALRRVSILSSERYKGVKIELKEGAMAISTNNPDLGEAVEEMEIDYKGRLLSIGFNARYLLDVLGVLGNDGEIDVKVKDEVSPGLVTAEGDEHYLYVVMPMRL